MAGIIVIASMLPLCHLLVTLRFFQPSRLGFVTKIYPLLGLDPHLEFLPRSTIPMTYTMCTWHTPRKHSHRICAPKTRRYWRTSKDLSCLTHLEQLKGLTTLLAFHILQPLRPYFMPAALMGFPLQSLLPVLKPWSLQILCFRAVHLSIRRPILSDRT
jgi:hypothetical protein